MFRRWISAKTVRAGKKGHCGEGCKEKIEQALYDNGVFDYDKVYVIAHIDGAFCISITEVELVFNADADEAYISDAVALVQAASGDEITVRYSKSR